MQFITSIAFLATAIAGVYAQGPQINTPASIVECQPTQLTFSGGAPPYFLSILPGGQISAPPLENLPQQNGNSFTWVADIASGTSITLQIRDSQGVTAFSGIVPIQAGTDSSCVGKNSQSGSSTGSASGTAPPSSGSSPASSAPATSAPSTPATTSKPATSTSAPATTAPSSASKPATSPAGTSSASPAATSKPNAALTLNSSPTAGFIGMLLAALLI